jgi:EAL domain-containing protein (putative c-di-GMP-specific phosphodiesterase class I)
MHCTKNQGRDRFGFYADDMNARAHERLAMEMALHRALRHQEFELHYQPKVGLASGRIVGAEALLRWRHPERGLVPPGEFIPLAEESGLILPIGAFVLEAACAQIRAWRDSGLPNVPVAVNLSARQLNGQDIPALVAQILAASGLDASALELEVTESQIMHNVEAAAAMLHRLRAMGVRIAIDDFGTGYSSLAYLKRFTINTLKIDRSFVRDIAPGNDDAAIVSAIVAMAHRLKFSVVAEGVETAEQLAFLRAAGCDEVQGYYYSPPIPADAFGRLLAAETSGTSAFPAIH